MGAYTKAGWPPAAALVFGAGRAGASEEDATRFAGGCCADAAGCADRFKVSSRWRWSRTFCTLMRGLLAPLESSSLNDVFFFDILRAAPATLGAVADLCQLNAYICLAASCFAWRPLARAVGYFCWLK